MLQAAGYRLCGAQCSQSAATACNVARPVAATTHVLMRWRATPPAAAPTATAHASAAAAMMLVLRAATTQHVLHQQLAAALGRPAGLLQRAGSGESPMSVNVEILQAISYGEIPAVLQTAGLLIGTGFPLVACLPSWSRSSSCGY
jgi:hypothetical protein